MMRNCETGMRTAFFFLLLTCGSVRAATIYFVTGTERFGALDTSSGAVNLISQGIIGPSGGAISFDSSGNLDLLDSGHNPGEFFRIDPANGQATLVGNTSQRFSGGLTEQPGTGVLFTAAGDTLYTIDPNSLASTTIGPLGLSQVSTFQPAFGPTGTLYVLVIKAGTPQDQLFSVSTVTGSATEIGLVGQNLSTIFTADGLLYGTGTGSDSHSLYTLNTNTGAATFLRTIDSFEGSGGGTVISSAVAAAPVEATPEPSTFTLIATSLIVLGARYRRHGH